MVEFIRTWVTIIVVFFALNLSFAVFSPIINQTFSDLVDIYAWNNAELLSAKIMVVGFFNLFPFIMSFTLLVWGVLNSLRREEGEHVY